MYKGALGRKAWRNSRRGETISPGTSTKQLLWPTAAFRAERASSTTPGSSCSFTTTPYLSARKCGSAVTPPVSFSSLTISEMWEQRRKSEVLYKKLNYIPLWVVRRWKRTQMSKVANKTSSLLCTEETEECLGQSMSQQGSECYSLQEKWRAQENDGVARLRIPKA